MAEDQNKSSSDELEEGGRRAADGSLKTIKGIKDAPENARRGVDTAKKGAQTVKKAMPAIKKGVSTATKAAKKALETIADGIKALIELGPPGWIILIVIILVLIIIIIYPHAMMKTEKDDNPMSAVSSVSYAYALDYVAEFTAPVLEEAYENIIQEANENLDDYLEENYPEYREYISLELLNDTQDQVAENIVGYIQAVHAVLQSYLPLDHGEYAPGFDEKFTVVEETEYNTLGDKYLEVVKDYVDNHPLFYIGEFLEDVHEAEIEIPRLDDEGNQIYDRNGDAIVDKKTVMTGAIYLDVLYDVSAYKEEDIQLCAEQINHRIFEDEGDEDECFEKAKDAISEMLYALTGSWEIPSPHTKTQLVRHELLPDAGYIGEIPVIADLADIPPGYYPNGTAMNAAIWQMVYDSASLGAAIPNSRGSKQCTDFAHWFFWVMTGRNCGNGWGDTMAANTANLLPDYELSGTPAPGAVFSVYAGVDTSCHVGIVVGFDGTNITICDGNYDGGGIRWYVTMPYSEFCRNYTGVEYAVPIK